MPSTDDELEAWAPRLPYPVAAAVWSFIREEHDRARLESGLFVFEVVARYLGVLALSGLRADRAVYEAARPSWQGGGGAPPSVIMRRATLGSWVRFDADTAKAIRRRLQDDRDGMLAAFALPDPGPLAAIASRAVGGALAEAVQRRNEWLGHAAGVSDAERRRRVEALSASILALRGALAGALDGWHLIQPRSIRIEGDGQIVELLVFDGPNARVRSRTMTLTAPVRTDTLYAIWEQQPRALELVPLIQAARMHGGAESAVYFFDRIDGDESRWLSYDSEAQPERFLATPAWLTELLTDLDLPAGAGSVGASDEPEASETDAEPAPEPEAPATTAVGRGDGRPPIDGSGRHDRSGDPLAAALTRLDPEIEVRTEAGRTNLWLGRRIGWWETWGRDRRLTLHVPIERAPQLAGVVVTEIPVSADSRPAISFAIGDAGGIPGALAAIATAAALERGADLSADDTLEAMRASLEPMGARVPRFGNGTWPDERLGRASMMSAREAVAVALGFEASDPRVSRAPGQIRVAWAEGLVASIRVSAWTIALAAEFDDGDHPEQVDRIAARHLDFDREAGRPLAWQRHVGSLLALSDLELPPQAVLDAAVLPVIIGSLQGLANAMGEARTRWITQ